MVVLVERLDMALEFNLDVQITIMNAPVDPFPFRKLTSKIKTKYAGTSSRIEAKKYFLDFLI